MRGAPRRGATSKWCRVNARTVLHALLAVVASSAAVLSFAALRDLALVCGVASQLAWLLPVVIGAGAAAGSLVWLGGWTGYAARIRCPVLILRAKGSWELTPERMPKVVGVFSGAPVTVVDVDGSANLEVEAPDAVAAAIRKFLT